MPQNVFFLFRYDLMKTNNRDWVGLVERSACKMCVNALTSDARLTLDTYHIGTYLP